MKILWFKLPCGIGNHREIISAKYTKCLTCDSVRRVDNHYHVGYDDGDGYIICVVCEKRVKSDEKLER